MALVAFDLDNTLGSFDPIGPWANFFSVETLENGENKMVLSDPLKNKIRDAETMFIEKVKACPELFDRMFRPNLDVLIAPIVKAKKSGKVRAVCMYSNTFSTFTMYFAKRIIEERYSCPNLFDCLVDSTHPIRKYDWDQNKDSNTQPLKTFVGLKRIFKNLCGVKDPIYPDRILFVDDRSVKHHLEEQEKDGLTYLQLNSYVPEFSRDLRGLAYLMGLQTLLESGLTNYPPYLKSEVCAHSSDGGFFKLLKLTEEAILKPFFPAQEFREDTKRIRQIVTMFLSRFSKVGRGRP